MNNQDTNKYTVILNRCGELCVSFRTGSAGHEGRIRRAATGSAVGAGTFFRSRDWYTQDRAARRDMDRQGAGPNLFGQRAVTNAMSALDQKQTCAAQKVMSALPPKADMCGAKRDVRFVPIADILQRN